MRVYTEHVLFDRRTTRQRTDAFALHCHAMHECYFFLAGDVQYLVEGVSYTLQKPCLLLMSSGVFHGVRVLSDAPYTRYALHFDEAIVPQPLRAVLLAPFAQHGIYYDVPQPEALEPYFTALGGCAHLAEPLRGAALSARVAALLSCLCGLQTPQRQTDAERPALDQQIVAYVNANLTQPLSPEDIARHFFISRNQLCRRFSRATGTTVAAYIRQKRLVLAQRLIARGQSAAEAAANAGFGDYSTYYRACKKMPRGVRG